METTVFSPFLKIYRAWAPAPDLALNTVGISSKVSSLAPSTGPTPSPSTSQPYIAEMCFSFKTTKVNFS